MLRSIGARNILLSMTTNFLDNEVNSIESILNQIEETPPSQLATTFSFLCHWILDKSDKKDDPAIASKLQNAYKILGVISSKIPPFFLLNIDFDINTGINQAPWALSSFIKPLNDRLAQLRSYAQPISFYYYIDLRRIQYFDMFFPSHNSELDLDPSFQIAYTMYFKRLILNHAPIDRFRILLGQRNSRIILTRAFTDVLDELNNCKTGTYEQIGFSFSYIFIYINSFIMTNEIDIQMLCKFIQTRPYLSPFLLLAIVNHIPQNVYLFNLLTPKELTQNLEQVTNLDSSHFNIQDFTDAARSKIGPFVKQIPLIVSNYFLCNTNQQNSDNDINVQSNDTNFLSFIHLSSNPMYIKMKDSLRIARTRMIGAFPVSCMGILLLRWIILSLQRTIIECNENDMFSPNFCYFIKTVISLLSPAFSSSVCAKFLDPNEKKEEITSFIIRGAYFHALHIVAQNDTVDNFRMFLFKALTIKKAESSARLIFGKTLQSDAPKMTEKSMELVENCNDILTVLEFIEALSMSYESVTCEENKRLETYASKLMTKYQIEKSTSTKVRTNLLFIESIRDSGQNKLNPISQKLIKIISQIPPQSPLRAITSLIENQEEHIYVVMRMLSFTKYMRSPDVAKYFVNHLCGILDTYDPKAESMHFEIRPYEFAYLLSQTILGRLLVFGFKDLALRLFLKMENMVIHDTLALHWIVRFLTNFKSEVPPDLLREFKNVVQQLEGAKELFIEAPDDVLVERLTSLLVAKIHLLLQEPDIVNYEYSSPYEHAHKFALCNLFFLPHSNKEIARMLTRPIYDLSRIWLQREKAVLCSANLAANLSNEVSQNYFQIIMENEPNKLSIIAGRHFLIYSSIEVFAYICQTCNELIGSNPKKLDAFMRMIVPSFSRLKGNDSIASRLLCKILETVNEETPRAMQETVIDVVAFLYGKLNLKAARPTFIHSAAHFSVDLRSIIASSLDL